MCIMDVKIFKRDSNENLLSALRENVENAELESLRVRGAAFKHAIGMAHQSYLGNYERAIIALVETMMDAMTYGLTIKYLPKIDFILFSR